MKILHRILMFLACMAVIAVVSVRKDNRLLGHSFDAAPVSLSDTTSLSGDSLIIHTALLGSDVQGYAGATPLDVYLCNNRIVKIVPLPNSETPEFFGEATALLATYQGKTPTEALQAKVDGVSGATFSSNALIANMQRAMAYASSHAALTETSAPIDAKTIVVLVVILMGMTIPLFVHNKTMRLVQMALDVVVLGFFSGTFVSYTLLTSLMTNGIASWAMLPAALLVVAAFIYPLFGRKAFYCTHLCPLGASQELMFKIPGRKLHIGKRTAQWLTRFKQGLWCLLTLLMVAGVGFEWMNYEPFTAFMLTSASVAVIILAVVILLTSVFIPRPYCRFVCPTGTLLKQR